MLRMRRQLVETVVFRVIFGHVFWQITVAVTAFRGLIGCASWCAPGTARRVGSSLSSLGRGLCSSDATSFLIVVSQYYGHAQLYLRPLSEPDERS